MRWHSKYNVCVYRASADHNNNINNIKCPHSVLLTPDVLIHQQPSLTPPPFKSAHFLHKQFSKRAVSGEKTELPVYTEAASSAGLAFFVDTWKSAEILKSERVRGFLKIVVLFIFFIKHATFGLCFKTEANSLTLQAAAQFTSWSVHSSALTRCRSRHRRLRGKRLSKILNSRTLWNPLENTKRRLYKENQEQEEWESRTTWHRKEKQEYWDRLKRMDASSRKEKRTGKENKGNRTK